MNYARDLATVFVMGILVHLFWVARVPVPTDVDPSYYVLVARNIVAGDGAVTTAVWQLLWVPQGLPFAADMHWMPLPSRFLVPFTWLAGDLGPRLATVLAAATWGPIAWASARRLGASRGVAFAAAALALWVPGYLRRMDTPDSIALYGMIGGAAFLAASHRDWRWTAGLAGLAALTRNDGMLLAPCLALAFSGWRMAAVGLSGPVVSFAWTARMAALAGPGYLEARSMVGALSDKSGLLGAEPTVMPMGERLAFAAGDGLSVALVMWLLVLPIPGVWALFSRLKMEPVARSAAAYAFGMPFVAMLSAPAVATYGSIYRSSAAMVPLLAAISALSLAWMGRWVADRFEQPPWVLPGFLMVLWLGSITVAGPLKSNPVTPLGEAECALLDEVDTPLFTADPLFAAERCGLQAVLHSAYQQPGQRAELAERLGVRWALAPRSTDRRGHAMHQMDPGWVEVSPRLWRFQPTQ